MDNADAGDQEKAFAFLSFLPSKSVGRLLLPIMAFQRTREAPMDFEYEHAPHFSYNVFNSYNNVAHGKLGNVLWASFPLVLTNT